MSDDGFHEIQPNGKQLIFLFMAATVVSVVIFLCGVMVGRGVRSGRGETTPSAALETPRAGGAGADRPAASASTRARRRRGRPTCPRRRRPTKTRRPTSDLTADKPKDTALATPAKGQTLARPRLRLQARAAEGRSDLRRPRWRRRPRPSPSRPLPWIKRQACGCDVWRLTPCSSRRCATA